MGTKNSVVPDTAEIATRILAGGLFAADFLAVKDLLNPRSKLRLALDRGASSLIERELPRAFLDPDVLEEGDRAAYEEAADTVRSRYGEQIRNAPLDPPRELVEELAERAILRGSYASAADALEYLGTRNKRVGDLVASGIETLKSAAPSGFSPDATENDSRSSLRSAAEAFNLAVRLKNPLEPLFQTRAIAFHFRHTETREKFYKALVTGKDDEVVEMSIDYLVGDREISETVLKSLTRSDARRALLGELARVLSGGDQAYAKFMARYRASVEVLRAGGEKPDPLAVQKALSGDEPETEDGIALLESLAVIHPVSALVCRTVLVPRQGQYLIPTVFEGNSAMDVLGLS